MTSSKDLGRGWVIDGKGVNRQAGSRLGYLLRVTSRLSCRRPISLGGESSGRMVSAQGDVACGAGHADYLWRCCCP